MTIDPISLGSANPVDRLSGLAGSPAALAETSARAIAETVIGRIASELQLAPQGGGSHDLGAITDAVAAQFPNSPAASVGELARAVEDLASALAVDMAALADGRTLDRLDAALADAAPGGAHGLPSVTQLLEQAATSINAAH